MAVLPTWQLTCEVQLQFFQREKREQYLIKYLKTPRVSSKLFLPGRDREGSSLKHTRAHARRELFVHWNPRKQIRSQGDTYNSWERNRIYRRTHWYRLYLSHVRRTTHATSCSCGQRWQIRISTVYFHTDEVSTHCFWSVFQSQSKNS